MHLLLSSDALPGVSLGDLGAVSRRRALAGLELTLGADHGHRVDAAPGYRLAETPAVPVAWLLLPKEVPLALRTLWMRTAQQFGAGVLLQEPVPERSDSVRTALVHGTDMEEARRAAEWAEAHDASTCWQVHPTGCDPDLWATILEITGPRLAHVRLLGAGPEAQTGGDATDGTGMLLSRLALRGFGGTLSLVPSSAEHLGAWAHWLLKGRGWGCGTAAEKQAAAQARRQPATT